MWDGVLFLPDMEMYAGFSLLVEMGNMCSSSVIIILRVKKYKNTSLIEYFVSDHVDIFSRS